MGNRDTDSTMRIAFQRHTDSKLYIKKPPFCLCHTNPISRIVTPLNRKVIHTTRPTQLCRHPIPVVEPKQASPSQATDTGVEKTRGDPPLSTTSHRGQDLQIGPGSQSFWDRDHRGEKARGVVLWMADCALAFQPHFCDRP